MDKVEEIDPNTIRKAVLAWTGYQSETIPKRSEVALNGIFAPDEIRKLMPIIATLEDAFYESKAHLTAPSLEEMGKSAAKEFREKYPTLPAEVSEAFAWCYTFDYK